MYTNIKTVEDAFRDQGMMPEAVPDYSKCTISPARVNFHQSLFDYEMVLVSVNKDDDGNEWVPGPDDKKYFPWMFLEDDASKPSGVGLAWDGYGGGCRDSRVSARLTCRDAKRARYVFDTFRSLVERVYIFHK